MLKVGSQAPGFRLQSDEGKEIALQDFVGQRVLLFFFPKAKITVWAIKCPGFHHQKKHSPKRGVSFLRMSAAPLKAQPSSKPKQNLNFPLLSVPRHKTIQKFGA